MAIHTCGRCDNGWLSSSFRDGNSMAGEPCGCETYTCDDCDEHMDEDELTENSYDLDLCQECLEKRQNFDSEEDFDDEE